MRFSQISVLLCAVGVLAAPGANLQGRDLEVSQDGKCGGSTGQTCLHSFLGDCCSAAGVCGTTLTFCGEGCQKGFGKCIPTWEKKLVSQDGTCGDDVTCHGSDFGSCCSEYGFCGPTSEHCGTGCQKDNGNCYGSGIFDHQRLRVRDPNPTCPSSNNTVYTTDNGNQYQVLCSIDHAGGDMKMVYVNSNKIADCISQCESTDGCISISMSGTACYMKSKLGAPVKNSVVRGAVFIGKASSSSSASLTVSSTETSGVSSSSSGFSAVSPSVSSSDSSIISSPASPASSLDRSASLTSSSSSAYPTTTSPTCPAANNTVFIADSGATFLIECYVDHSGGDMKMVYVNSNRIADCINQCDATTGCIDISMSGTACYMKNEVGTAVSNKVVRGARMIKAAPTSSSSSSSVVSTSSLVSGSASSSTASTTFSSSSIFSSDSSSSLFSPTSSSSSSGSGSSSSSISSALLSSFAPSISATRSKIVTANSTTSSLFLSSSVNLSTGVSNFSVIPSQTKTNSTLILATGLGSFSSVVLSTGGSSETTQASSAGHFANGTSSSSFTVSSTMPLSTRVVLSTGASSVVSSSSVGSGLFGNGTSSVPSSGPIAPVGTGLPSGISSSRTGLSPYGNGTSSAPSVKSTIPVGTGVSLGTGASNVVSSSSAGSGPFGNSTASSVGPTAPLSTGASRAMSSSSDGSGPYGNGTTSTVSPGPTGPLSTVVSLSTGVSSFVSSGASFSGAPYGNGTSTSVTIGTGSSGSVHLSTGVSISSSSSVIVAASNSTASLSATTVYNLTSSISSSVVTLNATSSSASAPLTTAPASNVSSTSTAGRFTNSSSVATTTSAPVYAFENYGGITSGHPVATNTTACSTKPTSSASCRRCEGQPGTDQFCGYTAYDNSYEVMPITCNTVTYSLDLTECIVAPDGVSRPALCVNGQSPGPQIKASWGDTVIVHVTNSMSRNGSSVHWHGMRQNYTNEMDGVVGITQCALAPGQTMTYEFKASNYGNSWYHSHLTLQAYEGLFGPMLIEGPTTGDYDVDAGNLIIQDWSHIPVDDMYIDAEINGVRTMDTGLINGMNINPAAVGNITGERYTVPTEFVSGQKYLFHLVNTAIQSTYKFYIDNHTLTVISTDFVPIVPYQTDVLSINIGQRYQVIVEANQDVGDYFLRFDNQNACASTTNSDDIRGIIHYAGSSGGTPTSTAWTYPRKDNGAGGILGYCEDEPLASLVPAAPMNVGSSGQTVEHDLLVSNSNKINLYRWYLDGTTFQTNWADATLYDVVNNGTVPDYAGNLAIETTLGEWVYVIIESVIPLGHPIHLHGHDFHVLASGYGSYDGSVALNTENPPRRDVAFMPGDGPTGQGGYIVLAFWTDNPGVWLMHCHIGWHVAMGFALQFIEGKDVIPSTVSNTCLLNDVCDTWRPWADEHGIYTDDSGV